MQYASIRTDPPAHLQAIMDAVYVATELATHPKTAVAFLFIHLPGDGCCFLKRSWFQRVWMLPWIFLFCGGPVLLNQAMIRERVMSIIIFWFWYLVVGII